MPQLFFKGCLNAWGLISTIYLPFFFLIKESRHKIVFSVLLKHCICPLLLYKCERLLHPHVNEAFVYDSFHDGSDI